MAVSIVEMRASNSLWREARSILVRHCEEDGLFTAVIPGVHLMRFGWRSQPLVATQFPCMAMVIQGTKSVEFGETNLEYGAGQYLLTSIDVPATSRIVNASKARPLLAVGVQIDFAELKEVIRRCDAMPQLNTQPGITIFDADLEILDAVVRLLRLLDTPEHSKPLAPLIRQEILYRLLSGRSGSRLLEICRSGSPSNRIAEVTGWIKKHFAESFLVEGLAHHVGMSPSSFHQHFKAVTGMTPIQYQRRIRLQEARKSLLMEAINIGEASVRVGYESHSQFSKDYRQYFGRLPKDDIAAHAHGGASIDRYTPAAPMR
uniref:Transcriptional regulator, AraC family n=1 Tax=Solibacter usitatus (strain Ellin6076) TaxID=234267 RepID=Q021L8_SOLUE